MQLSNVSSQTALSIMHGAVAPVTGRSFVQDVVAAHRITATTLQFRWDAPSIHTSIKIRPHLRRPRDLYCSMIVILNLMKDVNVLCSKSLAAAHKTTQESKRESMNPETYIQVRHVFP